MDNQSQEDKQTLSDVAKNVVNTLKELKVSHDKTDETLDELKSLLQGVSSMKDTIEKLVKTNKCLEEDVKNLKKITHINHRHQYNHHFKGIPYPPEPDVR